MEWGKLEEKDAKCLENEEFADGSKKIKVKVKEDIIDLSVKVYPSGNLREIKILVNTDMISCLAEYKDGETHCIQPKLNLPKGPTKSVEEFHHLAELITFVKDELQHLEEEFEKRKQFEKKLFDFAVQCLSDDTEEFLKTLSPQNDNKNKHTETDLVPPEICWHTIANEGYPPSSAWVLCLCRDDSDIYYVISNYSYYSEESRRRWWHRRRRDKDDVVMWAYLPTKLKEHRDERLND